MAPHCKHGAHGAPSRVILPTASRAILPPVARVLLPLALLLLSVSASAPMPQDTPSPNLWNTQRMALAPVKLASPLSWQAPPALSLKPSEVSLKAPRVSVRRGSVPLTTPSPLSWKPDRVSVRRHWELRLASQAPRWHRHGVPNIAPLHGVTRSTSAPGSQRHGVPSVSGAHQGGSRGNTENNGSGKSPEGGPHIPRAPEAITAGRRQMRMRAPLLSQRTGGTPGAGRGATGGVRGPFGGHTADTPQAAARSLAQRRAGGGRSVAQQRAEIRKKGFGRVVITEAQANWLVRQGKGLHGPSSESLTYYLVEARGQLMMGSRLLAGGSGGQHPCGSPVLGDAAFALLNALYLMLQGGKDRGAGFHQMLVVDTVTMGCVQRYSTPHRVGRAVRSAHDFILRATKWLKLHPDSPGGGGGITGDTKGGNQGGGGGGGGGRGGGGGGPQPKAGSPPVGSGTPPALAPGASTGNPIDDCWVGDPGWGSDKNRMALAGCARGYGAGAQGGQGGPVYVVTTTEDDPVNPPPGSLRYGATRDGPLWIVFAGDMEFTLAYELYVSSHKTIDGRGAKVSFSNGQCIEIMEASNVIIHGINFYKCAQRLGSAKILVSANRVRHFGHSQGNALSLLDSRDVWVDHCSFDGIQNKDNKHVNVKEGSTGVTVSNSRFSNTDYVMLLGHNDTFVADRGMRVTIMLNLFAENLTQRMPRCRFGNFHVVNNYYPYGWSMYAIGGSAGPTILSEANYFVASRHKEVTKRNVLDPEMMKQSVEWNWKSQGDVFKNGAFFRESGSQPPLQVPYKYNAIDATDVPKATARAGPLICRIGTACV